jgi:putative DNA primase/helicase
MSDNALIIDDAAYKAISPYLQENEVGIAKLITEKKRGLLRYDIKEGRWYQYGCHSWSKISDEKALEAGEETKNELKQLAEHFAQQKIEATGRDKELTKECAAIEKELLRVISKIGDVSVRISIMRMCRSEGSYLGFNGPWDADPYLVAMPNGILNLKDLTVTDGRPEENIRTSIPTLWNGINAECPLWEKTILEIFDGNSELVDYLQRVFGYGLSGLTKHHHLWIFEGRGRNGKSLVYKVIKHVLGDLVGLLDRELLLDRKHHRQSGQATPDVLNLMGKRMVFLIETTEGRKFDAGKLKILSGGDLLSGRGLYAKDYVTFQNTAKIFVLTNSRPHISGGDYAAWQRIVLVPFMLSFVPAPDPDHRKTERLANPDLEEALKKETSGILAWLVKGYVKAANEGLIPPDGVRVATNEYKKEEDTVGRFVEERIEKFIGSEIRAGKAYETYKEWCESEGIKPKHNTTFGREIRNHLEVDTRREKVFYTNVRLKD